MRTKWEKCLHRVRVAFNRHDNPYASRPCVLRLGHVGPHRTAKGDQSANTGKINR